MAQLSREEDPWLGGSTARYTEPQRRAMIGEALKTYEPHTGCQCDNQRCPVHPGAPCPFAVLPASVDRYKVLTPQHLGQPSDHHLSKIRAFCQPCNRNAPRTAPWPQHTSHTHTHTEEARTTLAALKAARQEIRDDPTTSSGKKLNLDHEVEYRGHMFRFITEGRKYTRSQANNSARELSDSGKDAAYGYAARLFSDEGPLTDENPTVAGKKDVVRFKDPADYNLTLEELEAKYPKEGRQK